MLCITGGASLLARAGKYQLEAGDGFAGMIGVVPCAVAIGESRSSARLSDRWAWGRRSVGLDATGPVVKRFAARYRVRARERRVVVSTWETDALAAMSKPMVLSLGMQGDRRGGGAEWPSGEDGEGQGAPGPCYHGLGHKAVQSLAAQTLTMA